MLFLLLFDTFSRLEYVSLSIITWFEVSFRLPSDGSLRLLNLFWIGWVILPSSETLLIEWTEFWSHLARIVWRKVALFFLRRKKIGWYIDGTWIFKTQSHGSPRADDTWVGFWIWDAWERIANGTPEKMFPRLFPHCFHAASRVFSP